MSEAVQAKIPESDSRSLGDFLQAWGSSLLASVLVGAGLSPALRGARAGLDDTIEWVDRLGSTLSQFTAILTGLLAVHLSLTCVRHAHPRSVSLLLSIVAAIPIVTLMGAQHAPLGAPPILLALGATGVVLVMVSAHLGSYRAVHRVPMALAGASMIAHALGAGLQLRGSAAELLLSCSSALAFLCVAQVTWLLTRASRGLRLFLPVALFLPLLGAMTISAGTHPDSPFLTMLLGRTLENLQNDGSAGSSLSSYGLCLALLMLIWTLASSFRPGRRDNALLALAGLPLCVVLTPAPLVLAAATLIALSGLAVSHTHSARE